jgi:hypothetical protein
MGMNMDRLQMQSCLETVAAFRASGQRADEWAQGQGMSVRALSSWCAHAARWQATLDGVRIEPARRRKPGVDGFVAASLPPSMGEVVRVEIQAGQTRVQLHWPLGRARELATFLREMAR